MSTWGNLSRKLLNELDIKWDSNSVIQISTSGSTGNPKKINFEKSLMQWSAEQTLKYCIKSKNLKQLIALPIDKAGGLMQWARAKTWDAEFDIIEPSSNPLLEYNGNATIISLTPMQLTLILNSQKSRQVLNQFETILIGGGELTKEIEIQAMEVSPKTKWIHTFGMTETYSHFAYREFGDDLFKLIDQTEICMSESGLMIKNPCTKMQWLQTNDIVNIIDHNSFQWEGRIDFTINSGGIKIQLETIERMIHAELNWTVNSFFCWWKSDKILGQKLIVCSISENQIPQNWSFLPQYHEPKEIIIIPKIILSSTGKVLRQQSFLSFNEK